MPRMANTTFVSINTQWEVSLSRKIVETSLSNLCKGMAQGMVAEGSGCSGEPL